MEMEDVVDLILEAYNRGYQDALDIEVEEFEDWEDEDWGFEDLSDDEY